MYHVPHSLRARYDAAVTNEDNYRHWANADSLSANASASVSVRHMLRNRARYETANNSYAKGIVLTCANDTIGTGPRLQVLTDDPKVNRRIEAAFASWARAVNLAKKLLAMKTAKMVDGEAFALLVTNPRVGHDVKLDLRLIEAEQVSTPDLTPTANHIDGVRFDAYGNPSGYDVLRAHPGSDVWDDTVGAMQYDTRGAEQVLHLFRVDRPGQQRGVSELTPALPLFAQLRRYTLAVIASAETVAELNVFMQSRQGADNGTDIGEDYTPETYDQIPLTPAMMTVMPFGYEAAQVRAEQPATTYDMFVQMILKEIARCLNVPHNVATGDSSSYNYASGQLDHQLYFKAVAVERAVDWDPCCDRILTAWFDEAALIPGLLPDRIGLLAELPYQFCWDGREYNNPVQQATADKIRLETNRDTLAYQYARENRDWEVELRQRAKEKELLKELGLKQEEAAPNPQSDGRMPEEDGPPRQPTPEERAKAA